MDIYERWGKEELHAECVRQAKIANGAMREADMLKAKNGELAREVMRLDEQLEGAVEALEDALDLAAEAIEVSPGYSRRLKELRARLATYRGR